jgi:hypothetical protein
LWIDFIGKQELCKKGFGERLNRINIQVNIATNVGILDNEPYKGLYIKMVHQPPPVSEIYQESISIKRTRRLVKLLDDLPRVPGPGMKPLETDVLAAGQPQEAIHPGHMVVIIIPGSPGIK